MSTSKFDDLLADDFKVTSTTKKTVISAGDFDDNFDPFESTTNATASYGDFDNFDPFGSSAGDTQTAHLGNSEILFDFLTETEKRKSDTSSRKNIQSESSLFQTMSTDAQNPLYDLSSAVDNDLYSSPSGIDTNEGSHHFYEFTVEKTTKTEPGSNPLYDGYDFNTAADEDLLSGSNEQQEGFDYGQRKDHNSFLQEHYEVQREEPGEQEHYHVHEEEPEEQEHYEVEVEEPEELQHYEVEEPEEQEHYEVQQEEAEEPEFFATKINRGSRQPQDDRSDDEDKYSGGDVEEEEKNTEDGESFLRTSHTVSTYSSSGVENTSHDFSSNHWDEGRRNLDFDKQTSEHDSISFSETSVMKTRLESEPTPAPRKQINIEKEVLTAEGGVYESQPQHFEQWQNEAEREGGVYENQPQLRDDVIRESDSDKLADLPPIGTAQSLRAKFMSAQPESTTQDKHEPVRSKHSEYVSEARDYTEKHESKIESGVFENEPVHHPDVVRSGEEVKEELPEKGMARNLANRFCQISTENSSASVSRAKRDITPERSSQTQSVSEPHPPQIHDYSAKVDAGVFENEPQRSADVITSDSVPEDYIPERGFARNVAAKFREMESQVKSPPASPVKRKEFTLPRQDSKPHQPAPVEVTAEIKHDIVHATDPQEEALPEIGTARNIAERFRQMAAENKTSVESKSSHGAKKEHTTLSSSVSENQPKQFSAEYNRSSESGISENQPVRRDDVVRGDEPPKYEDELPERGTAKNLVNRWRQMESEGAKIKSPGSSVHVKGTSGSREEARFTQQKQSTHSPLSPRSPGRLDNGTVHPSELPGQYQPQTAASVFESSPQQRPDAVREGDTDLTDGMPMKDIAKQMRAKFQSIEAEASKQAAAQALRRDSECCEPELMENDGVKVSRSKSMRAAIQVEKCGACEKTVYAMERMEMNKRVYHRGCFRCTQCKAVLTPKTFAINNEIIFCTTHYKQLFATKGNYDEGFGRVQHKKRWSSNPNLAKDGDYDDDKF